MTSSTHRVLLSVTVCCLVTIFAAAPAAANPSASPAPMCTDSASDADRSKGGLETDGTCSASCGSAPQISTPCNGTCQGIDRNCAAGERGRVTCNGVTMDQCAVCPIQPCLAFTVCPDGTQLSCEGSSPNSCMGGPGLCFVRCDNNYSFCPGYEFQFLC